MGIELGPYFATFVALVRRLSQTGSNLERDRAPDETVISMRRTAAGDVTWEIRGAVGDEPETVFCEVFEPAMVRPAAYPLQRPFTPTPIS